MIEILSDSFTSVADGDSWYGFWNKESDFDVLSGF
jgi:hypothetical protein